MNRRKFFRAAASFVAGCAIGVGFRPKLDAMYCHQTKVTPDYEYMIFFDRDVKHAEFASADGVRSITYRQVDGEWIKDEPARKT